MKRVLMIAFHFPPLAGSSGIQRTLRFTRYLPQSGWEPIVLGAHPRAFEQRSDDQIDDIPMGTHVVRAPAWDTARHFAIQGRYPAFLARPDRWRSWWCGAIPLGLAAIKRFKPAAIWSTYPIPTAHAIGKTLATMSGLPWVADFRDPMAQDGYPTDPKMWQSFAKIERDTVRRARFSTFTTPSAVEMYRQRYPDRAEDLVLLENGYDEDTFSGLEPGIPLVENKLTLLHSGLIYPRERNPRFLFEAVSLIRRGSPDLAARLKLRFRAPVHDALLHRLATEFGIEDQVETLPPIGYREALSEMVRADGLLILQAGNCNAQVPAKLYEYLRAKRPILALTDPVGDTARVAREACIEAIAPLDDVNQIADLLTRFIAAPREGTLASESAILAASRQARTAELAQLLERTGSGAM